MIVPSPVFAGDITDNDKVRSHQMAWVVISISLCIFANWAEIRHLFGPSHPHVYFIKLVFITFVDIPAQAFHSRCSSFQFRGLVGNFSEVRLRN